MTEAILGKKSFDIYFSFLVWTVSPLLTWRGGTYDLYCSQTPGGIESFGYTLVEL